MQHDSKNDISIVLCGAAGQGIATVEELLTKILKKSGLYVFSTSEFMSRVRGGTNSTTIRVSSQPVRAYCDRIDILIPLTKEAVGHVKSRITQNTCIIGDENLIGEHPFNGCTFLEIDFTKIAEIIGNRIYSNSVAIGVLATLFKTERKLIDDILTEQFHQKGIEIVQKNLEAANKGADIIEEVLTKKPLNLNLNISRDPNISSDLILSGRDAIALGAIAGGCSYVCFYPMAPSTGIASFIAQYGEDFGIIVDQSEDEISAINKCYGAWYAGARGFVTTSGGGFALMTETISLIGVTESPMVINLGQRPGPATGMPTRTEQGDLQLALHAGHGDFPRILLAPGSIEEAFILTQEAFNLADKFQVPVIILSDHYIVNSAYNLSDLSILNLTIPNYFVETAEGYQRYEFTDNGISPRGIPGYGKGMIRVDSHTHTEDGYITEDASIRNKSVEKMMKKLEMIKYDAFPPKFIGPSDYNILMIGWGSNYHIIEEVLAELREEEYSVAFLHFLQVFPLPRSTLDYLKKADKIIIIENNATGQFANLIKVEFGHEIPHKILKYSGYPFSVEELLEKVLVIIRGD
ncbi:2-oxoacid:acceptor oxidoreductase subunit alpha [Candidatus Hodarchaeum mangrovi]